METTDALQWIALAVQVTGILAALPIGYLIYRNSIEDAERRRDERARTGSATDTHVGGAAAAALLRAKTDDHDLAPEEVSRLRLLAGTLSGRRPLALLSALFPATQAWLFFSTSGWWTKAIGLLLVVYYLTMAIGIERNARAANAFLRRHPAHPAHPAPPTFDRPTGDPTEQPG